MRWTTIFNNKFSSLSLTQQQLVVEFTQVLESNLKRFALIESFFSQLFQSFFLAIWLEKFEQQKTQLLIAKLRQLGLPN